MRSCPTEVIARDVAQIHPAAMGTLCSTGDELICIVDLGVRLESGMHAHRRFAEFLHACEWEHQLSNVSRLLRKADALATLRKVLTETCSR